MLKFNFAEKKESFYSKYLNPDILFFLLVLITMVSFIQFYNSMLEEEIQTVNIKIEQLNKEIRRLRKIQKAEKELLSMKKELQKKLAIVSQLEKRRNVPYFLYFFADPKNINGIWLDSLDYSNKRLMIVGGTFDISKLPTFLSAVESKLGNVVFKDTKRKLYKNPELNFEQSYYEFIFIVELKNGTAH